MSEYDAVKHNSPPTEQEIRKLDSFQYGSPKGWVMEEMLKQYGYTPNAHDNIDTLIIANKKPIHRQPFIFLNDLIFKM